MIVKLDRLSFAPAEPNLHAVCAEGTAAREHTLVDSASIKSISNTRMDDRLFTSGLATSMLSVALRRLIE